MTSVATPAAPALVGPRPPSQRQTSKKESATAAREIENDKSKPARSCVVTANPSVVHFGGFEVEKPHRMQLKLLNSGPAPIRYTLTPPTTPFFSIKYKKNDVFAPGIEETIDIEFVPTEYRYFYDTITVNCESGDVVVVPMHAYPVLAEISVPPAFDFGVCPIQVPTTKTFSIRCDVPIEFEYRVNVLSSNPAMTIAPTAGTIPAKGEAKITLTYTPLDYTTSNISFEVVVSQYNSKPVRCTAIGSCSPGALVTSITQRAPPSPPRQQNTNRTRTLRTREKREAPKSANAEPADAAEPAPTIVDGLVIPQRLDTVAAVNYVLNQSQQNDKGLKAKLVGPTYRKIHNALEREFVQEMRQAASKLPELGEEELSHDARREILAARRVAEEQYASAKDAGPAAVAAALARTQTQLEPDTRTFRIAGTSRESLHPTFSQHTQLSFNARMQALQRFVQAARRVIVRSRLLKRLQQLKHHHLTAESAVITAAATKSENFHIDAPTAPLSSVELPVFESVPMPVLTSRLPLPVVLPSIPTPKQPFVDLVVPEHYRLLGYTTYTVQEAVYLPTEMDRPLRRIQDPLPAPPPRQEPRSSSARSTTTKPPRTGSQESNMTANTLPSATIRPLSAQHPIPASQAPSREKIDLAVPPQLSAPNLPACALNPIPGISAVLQPLHMGETDDAHLLHPFADVTVPHARVLPTSLSADLVPESMCMAGEAVSMAVALNTVSLARFWIPRCSDPFRDTLPTEGPALLERQPDEDAAVNAAPPPPLPSVESIFYVPKGPLDDADAAHISSVPSAGNLGVEISVTGSDSVEPGAVPGGISPPIGLGQNFAGERTLFLREEREAMCEAAAVQTDTLVLRIAERESRFAQHSLSQAPPADTSPAAH